MVKEDRSSKDKSQREEAEERGKDDCILVQVWGGEEEFLVISCGDLESKQVPRPWDMMDRSPLQMAVQGPQLERSENRKNGFAKKAEGWQPDKGTSQVRVVRGISFKEAGRIPWEYLSVGKGLLDNGLRSWNSASSAF